jgi:hypothetical protein
MRGQLPMFILADLRMGQFAEQDVPITTDNHRKEPYNSLRTN